MFTGIFATCNNTSSMHGYDELLSTFYTIMSSHRDTISWLVLLYGHIKSWYQRETSHTTSKHWQNHVHEPHKMWLSSETWLWPNWSQHIWWRAKSSRYRLDHCSTLKQHKSMNTTKWMFAEFISAHIFIYSLDLFLLIFFSFWQNL